MANAPLSGRDGKSHRLISISEKQKYFCKENWTGQITLIRFNKLVFSSNAICPVQFSLQKYFCFSEIEISLCDLPSRPERGALAIVTNVGAGCGGRGSVARETGLRGGLCL